MMKFSLNKPLAGVIGALGFYAFASASVLEPRASTYSNPIVWEDLPDLDVFRVGSTYYYSSSSFAFSPGAPVHKSYDLVSWAPVSHSVPRLDFGNSKYDLTGDRENTGRAYVEGIWASSLRYRAKTDTFYWIGCVQSNNTYIYTSPGGGGGENPTWNWKQAAVLQGNCYYDCGILVDDDAAATMYVAFGSTNISVAQLSADGLSEVRKQLVYQASTHIEGSHMYKINGYYWIVPTRPAAGEWVLRSSSPWGPYEQAVLFQSLTGPLANAGNAHQGGMVDTPNGDWWYIAFMDSYPGGRVPVMAPMTWDANGWPHVTVNSSGDWGSSYTKPNVGTTSKTVASPTGVDTFTGTKLSDEWEWNHNPDTTKFKLAGGSAGGLILQTATVTSDLYSARNTLTHRIIGPKSQATFKFDISGMANGDRAGAVLFRDQSAYIGVHKDASSGVATIVAVNGLNLNLSWNTVSTGVVNATGPVVTATTAVWLRITADITPAFGLSPVRQGIFSYSVDSGKTWKQLGAPLLLTNDWHWYNGYRYGAFNFATKALGGQVTLQSFEMELA